MKLNLYKYFYIINMEPEKDEGNIEYKLKLLNCSDQRVEKLASQMRYRCNEGNSECIYNIGVEDDGRMTGVTKEEYNETLMYLKKAATKNEYIVTKLTETKITEKKSIYEVLIREYNPKKYIDIKVAIAGSVDCGKSTYLAVMVSGKKDDGRGSARLSVFNFPHEVETGRTSSIAQHIVGYDKNGDPVNWSESRKISWPDIVKKSSKIVSFYDLAGHEKYLKTTIRGLTSAAPDFCMIMISANRGVLKMTKEHVFLCVTLNIPFCIVITKTDMTKDKPEIFKNTLRSIVKLLKSTGIRRIPLRVRKKEDVIRCALHLHTESIVPLFCVSNVTLRGIQLMHTFLNLIGKKKEKVVKDSKVEFFIDTTWSISGVGTVVGGQLTMGEVNVGDKLWLGPNNNKYTKITVRSIHCKRVLVQKAESGCYFCFAIKGVDKQDIKRGNVIIREESQKVYCKKFKARIEVLQTHSTTIQLGYCPILHAVNIRIVAKLVDISNKVDKRNSKDKKDLLLRTGDSADVILELEKPFYIKNSTNILLCEGRTKVVGVITKVLK